MRTLAHGFERATLAVDGSIGIAVTELAFGLSHRLTGVAELTHLVALLPLLALLSLLSALSLLSGLAKPALAQLLEEFAEPVTQALLILTQVTKLVLALLLAALAIAAHLLALPVRPVAQLLLLADHVA